jgi:decaprenylphospho-beta-D-erythro-pentofuranosid-2-ulose 2-reductase
MATAPGIPQHIVIIGATSGIAEQCARLWAQQGARQLVLVARDQQKLQLIAQDLQVRNPAAHINCLSTAFSDPLAIKALADNIMQQGCPDLVLIAHGTLPDQAECQRDLTCNAQALQINGVSPVLFAEAFVPHLLAAGRGTLAMIGSVAGDRGRKSNYVYGAAKGLVTRYAQGLQHRLALAGSAVKVVLIKPGPTDTPMTAHLKQQGAKLASVDEVAVSIVQGIQAGKPTVYAPGKWALIMMIIRHLPRFVFNRMDI